MPTKRPYSSSTGDEDTSPEGPIYRVAPGGSSGGRLVPGGTELVPVPDPTKLTTDQLRREIMALREILEQRIEGIDRFIAVLKEQGDLRQQVVDKASNHLRELVSEQIGTLSAKVSGKLDQHVGETAERFAGVAAQFSERDTRTDQRAGDTKLAVDAAFAAAKEATSKIELGFTKQIDSMVLAMDTLSKNLDSKINDVKDMISDAKARLTAVESRTVAQKDFSGWIFGIIGVVVAAASVIVLALRH